MVKIMIADDHLAFSQSMEKSLNEVEGFQVIALPQKGSDVIAWLQEKPVSQLPDIILMDLFMEKNNHSAKPDGLRTSKEILDLWMKKKDHKIHIIILSGSLDAKYIAEAYELNIQGYLAKASGIAEIIAAINRIMDGLMYYEGKVKDEKERFRQSGQWSANWLFDLSKIEQKVLELIADGAVGKEIVEELNLFIKNDKETPKNEKREYSENSVEYIKKNLSIKFGARNAPNLVSLAYKNGYLKI